MRREMRLIALGAALAVMFAGVKAHADKFVAHVGLGHAGLTIMKSKGRGYGWGRRLHRFSESRPSFEFRFGTSHHRHRHVCQTQPIYNKVWVQPVYQRILIGYDSCGYPVYENRMVRAGYYHTEIVGYKRCGCGRGYYMGGTFAR